MLLVLVAALALQYTRAASRVTPLGGPLPAASPSLSALGEALARSAQAGQRESPRLWPAVPRLDDWVGGSGPEKRSTQHCWRERIGAIQGAVCLQNERTDALVRGARGAVLVL